ncbi:adhesion G protein-coupled receptor F5 isoform X2 [Dermochelys coriacea]|uniref:adhesion G protein-coupled receptor F5 isoform X2 n=1 Tax=Dermochelys coriacea TaxID=27794 RepID=UPI001CA83045|nr:adhesion G protein-coupled receptor F5 isoform X2 [Dermochelys coriacea]
MLFCNKVLGEMLSLGIKGFCFLLLIVTTSTHASMELNFDPFIHHSPDSKNGTEENIPTELHRQKRQVAALGPSPVEYKVDIEIISTDSSLLESLKDYFKNLSFPVIINTSINISSLNVTTVCSLTSNNETHCFCESGYGWPAAVCSAKSICPSTIPTQEETCDCITELPSQGPYCQLQPGGIPTITIKFSVRLGIVFQDALRNSSSELYKTYKKDLENAFTASYKSLPGFVSARVTGFRAGSLIVDYEIKAASATFTQIESASRNIQHSLDASYMLDPDSLEITGQTNFSVSPEDLFQGDTVIMNCKTRLDTGNVTWYHSGHVILNSIRHSIRTITIEETTKSVLEITNVTQNDTGPYTCVFMSSNVDYTLSFKATQNITVAPINIVQSGDTEVVCNGTNVSLSCCIDGNIQSFTTDWRPNRATNILGIISSTPNCTEYTLQANQSQCPNKSDPEIMYTCELSTGHGALRSKAIKVTYLRVANVEISSSTKAQVSQGHNFSLTCTSDVSNCNNVTWQIESQIIDSGLYLCNLESPSNVRSVLTVKAATQAWNGTYTCTFYQKLLPSSASTTVEIVPLPLKQNIVLDPIQGFIQCNVPQVLKCCIDGTENYDVMFTVRQREFKGVRKTQGNQVCYTYNYTESCNLKSDVMAYCTFVNHIQDKVKSSPMKLSIISENKVTCSNSIGMGQQGAQIIKPCPDSKDVNGTSSPVRGTIIYVCNNTSWEVARKSCISDQISTLLSCAESLVSGPQPAKHLATYLETLHNNTIKEQQEINNSSANLGAVITILDLVSTIPTDAERGTMTNFLSTVDIIVNRSTIPAWKDLNNQQTGKSSLLLNSVERFSRSLQPTNNNIPSINHTNLQLQGIIVTKNSTLEYNKNFTFPNSANLSGNVLIRRNETENLKPNSTIITVAFSTLRYILPKPNKTDMVVNGLVMTTTTSNSTLPPDFQISLTFAKSNSSLEKPQCVFWNFSLSDDAGGWDDTGCHPKDEGDNILCTCSHLTSFSILMSLNLESTPPEIPLQPLDYITYIGLSISIASLMICILIESLVWKYVTKNRTSYMRHVCILNIAVSLLIADIWFIVAASLQDTKELVNGNVCIAATFFIHLFYLSVFFWMLALGLMIFYRLVFILHDTSKTIQKAVAFFLGYGCPLIISVITIAVTQPHDAYRRENACWLNWEKSKALLAFIVPALIIVAVNSIIAVVILVKILRPAIGEKPSKQERSSLIQAIKNVATLTPLLGLTWGFGLATLSKDSSIVFHILFTLLNAFQGLFILVFGTLRDKKVLEALLNKYSFARWSTQQTKSTSLGDSAPVFSMISPFSGALNNLFGKTGKYKISSTETTGSFSEPTSNTYSVLH